MVCSQIKREKTIDCHRLHVNYSKCKEKPWNRAKHLHKSLTYPDNDNAAKVNPRCCRDHHIQERGCHNSKAKNSGGGKESGERN